MPEEEVMPGGGRYVDGKWVPVSSENDHTGEYTPLPGDGSTFDALVECRRDLAAARETLAIRDRALALSQKSCEQRDRWISERDAKITELRALLARTYNAARKQHWEEGECLNEVLSDVHWEGIAVPEIAAEQQRAAALEEGKR